MSVEAERADELPPVVRPVEPRTPVPVAEPERVTSVDVLRGVALLGILPMNIIYYAWPFLVYFDPTAGGGFDGLDRVIWIVSHLVFDQKMITIFSMLFGAGLVLMGERADARGRSAAGVYYRRIFWLLVIGGIHAYLIWAGDILFIYAECGLLMYPFRRLSARTLIIVGLLVILVWVPLGEGMIWGVDWMKRTAAEAAAVEAAGGKPTEFQSGIRDAWEKDVRKGVEPTPTERAEALAKDIDIYRDGYAGMVRHRAAELWGMHATFFLHFGWMIAGRMLLGMGLMKLGVFAASRPPSFYVKFAALGYALGLPLVIYDTWATIRSGFAFPDAIRSMCVFNYVGALLVALGHVGVVMLVCQSGALSWLTARLAAVGRMALTNYLMHSLICTTIFYGYGFGWFGSLNRTGMAGIVLAIWALQLAYSQVWLAHFRFGPAEWLWRSLTYWRWQPMRREVAVS